MYYIEIIDDMVGEVDDVMSAYPHTDLHKILAELYGHLTSAAKCRDALQQMTIETEN